jgi:hypothetical protein
MDVISTESLHVCGTSGTSYIQFLSQMWEASIHIVYVRDFLHSVTQSDVGGLYSYCIRQGLLKIYSVSQSDVGGLYSYCTQPTASSLVEVTDGIRSTSGSIRIKT